MPAAKPFLVTAFLTVVATIGFLSWVDSIPYEQVGHFKSDNRNRVMAYSGPVMSKEEATNLAQSRMHTPGQLTMTVIYADGATNPGHLLTLQDDYPSAVSLLFENETYKTWHWVGLINRSGELIWLRSLDDYGGAVKRS